MRTLKNILLILTPGVIYWLFLAGALGIIWHFVTRKFIDTFPAYWDGLINCANIFDQIPFLLVYFAFGLFVSRFLETETKKRRAWIVVFCVLSEFIQLRTFRWSFISDAGPSEFIGFYAPILATPWMAFVGFGYRENKKLEGNASGKRRKPSGCLIVAAATGLFSIIAIMSLFWFPKSERRAWKERAISEITRLSDDKNWLSKEIASLKATMPANPSQGAPGAGWLSDHMILMKNQEWLVYKSHCPKKPPTYIKDIFLAKGSDGKWYYSTCHFCIGMLVLLLNQGCSPPDIETFAKAYQLKEFDGKSDECLNETSPFPDDKGLEKANMTDSTGQ